MSDAISHKRKNEGLWDDARLFINIYYGYKKSENFTKAYIEKWCSQYGWTVESLAKELDIQTR